MRCPAVATVTYNWHPGEYTKDASSTCQYSHSPGVEGKNAEGVVMKSELSVNGGGVGHSGRGDGGPPARRRGEGSGGGGESGGGDDGLEAGDGGPGRGEEGSRG